MAKWNTFLHKHWNKNKQKAAKKFIEERNKNLEENIVEWHDDDK